MCCPSIRATECRPAGACSRYDPATPPQDSPTDLARKWLSCKSFWGLVGVDRQTHDLEPSLTLSISTGGALIWINQTETFS